MKRKLIISVMLIATILLTACGGSNTPPAGESTPDVAAVRTSAASTVISQFTLTAAAFTPTPSQPIQTTAPSTPGATNSATTQPIAQVTNAQGTTVALCDVMGFVEDVNIPDDTTMSPGQDFVKTWKVKNNGSCTWGEGYELVYADYADGDLSGQFQPITQVVQPGQEVELSVQFTAPDQVGQYLSAWQMANPSGITFPEAVYVKIIVQ
jgi:Ig-like domain-containing protein